MPKPVGPKLAHLTGMIIQGGPIVGHAKLHVDAVDGTRITTTPLVW